MNFTKKDGVVLVNRLVKQHGNEKGTMIAMAIVQVTSVIAQVPLDIRGEVMAEIIHLLARFQHPNTTN